MKQLFLAVAMPYISQLSIYMPKVLRKQKVDILGGIENNFTEVTDLFYMEAWKTRHYNLTLQ